MGNGDRMISFLDKIGHLNNNIVSFTLNAYNDIFPSTVVLEPCCSFISISFTGTAMLVYKTVVGQGQKVVVVGGGGVINDFAGFSFTLYPFCVITLPRHHDVMEALKGRWDTFVYKIAYAFSSPLL